MGFAERGSADLYMQQAMEQSSTRSTIDLERVRDVIAPVLAAHGVALVELEWLTERVGWTLRLTIERLEGTTNVDPRPTSEGSPEAGGGVTLEDCADVSRDASSVLDVEDLIPQRYNLEVSSPGLDRRLRTPAEFARFVGRTVKIKLARPAPDGQRLLRGELAAASEGRIAVLVDGKRVEVPLAEVVEARLVFELVPQPKKKGRRRAEADAPGKRRSERS
jgi:ribosome maturation factor RimP